MGLGAPVPAGTAFLSSMLYLPVRAVGDLAALRSELTLREPVYSPGVAKVSYTEVCCYDDSTYSGYFGVPRAFGLERFPSVRYKDLTVRGDTCGLKEFRGAITPRDSQQKAFMDSVLKACAPKGPLDIVANAKTGSGKTVTDLFVSANIGVPTLIIVPRNTLKLQWAGSRQEKNGMAFFFGDEFVRKHVGFVQQDVCDYEGKYFVIAMLQSLVMRRYPDEFYSYFGKITIDEVHKVAAPLMSKVLSLFPARIRIGYTATNKAGVLGRVCDLHLGKPKVTSAQEVLKPLVYICRVSGRPPFKVYHESKVLPALALWERRNAWLAETVYTRGYLRKRNLVVFADNVKQLQLLKDLLEAKGIPSAEIGLYVGQLYQRDEHGNFLDKKIKVKEAEYKEMAKCCSILLATYGIFDTGVDVPRLDMGVEAAPRTNLTQAIGRIVRFYPGKPVPEWYSLTDVLAQGTPDAARYAFLLRRAASRRKCFVQAGATIKEVSASYG